MDLWQLLVLVSAGTAVGGGLSAADEMGGGAVRVMLALLNGLLVGGAGIFTLGRIDGWVRSSRASKPMISALYCGTALWTIAAFFLAYEATRAWLGWIE